MHLRILSTCTALLLLSCVGNALHQDVTLAQEPVQDRERAIPDQAKPWTELSSEGVDVHMLESTLWLKLDSKTVQAKKAVIPRVSAPIRSIHFLNAPKTAIKFWPEQEEWVFSWKQSPPQAAVIEVVFDRTPVLPSDCPEARPAGDNSIMLHAYQASTFGEKLRFEPQWYKNTVGYWTVASDYATWKLQVTEPGTYSVALLQGCGKGQGGSDAVITLAKDSDVKAELPFKTVETGHFQNFRWNHLGHVELNETGSYLLRLDAKRIAANALFDVRMIHLVRQASPAK